MGPTQGDNIFQLIRRFLVRDVVVIECTGTTVIFTVRAILHAHLAAAIGTGFDVDSAGSALHKKKRKYLHYLFSYASSKLPLLQIVAVCETHLYKRSMFEADVGGMSSGVCIRNEALPVWQSADQKYLTVAVKSIADNTRQMLSFILNQSVDAVTLPPNEEVVQAFDSVLEACRRLQNTMQASISESGAEAVEATERGILPRSEQPLAISTQQLQLLNEIRLTYEHFLKMFRQATS